jgi:hypothetical protein
MQPGGITRATYGRAIPVEPVYSGGGRARGLTKKQIISLIRKGGGQGIEGRPTIAGRYMRAGPGRPKGTLDKRYAAYGGVYGWRKAIAHQRALERLQQTRESTISPEQQQYLNQLAMQQRQQQMDVENKPIPDTYGNVPLRHLTSEIDDAANLVP